MVRVDGKLMVVNFLRPENVSDAVSFSLSGRCTSMRFVQPENAELPMESTVSGIFTFVNEVQFVNALFSTFLRHLKNIHFSN